MIDDGSILIEIKKMLGLMADDETFDVDVMIHINSAFSSSSSFLRMPVSCFE